MAQRLTNDELATRTRESNRRRNERHRARLTVAGRAQTNVWLSAELRERLDGLAVADGVNLSAVVERLLSAALYEQPANNQNALAAAKIANLEADTRLKELREARERGELIPTEIVIRVWGNLTGAARAHLLGLPYRLATAAVAVDGMAAVEAVARDLIYQALQHLSEFNPADYLEQGQPQGLGAVT